MSATSRQCRGQGTGSLPKCQICHICNCVMFTDKAKTVSCTSLIEACPSEIPNEPEKFMLCSKCHTQVMKKQWQSRAADNGLAPDDILTGFASLSSDEVRTIIPHMAIKPYLILIMTDHYLLHSTVHMLLHTMSCQDILSLFRDYLLGMKYLDMQYRSCFTVV